MGDGYYYTLSAIAQSFAAIIALNAIFVIYKLQTIREQYNDLFKQIRQWWVRETAGPMGAGTTHQQYTTEAERLLENTLRHWLKERNGQGEIVDHKNKLNEKIENIDNLKRNIFYWFKRTLIANGFVIISSLILLPLRNFMSNELQITMIVLSVLLSYFVLVITIHSVLITAGFKGLRHMFSLKDEQN